MKVIHINNYLINISKIRTSKKFFSAAMAYKFKNMFREEKSIVLTAKHEEQVKNLIDKKVVVYLSLKKFMKVLRKDKNGLYVVHQKTRVPVKPDINGINVLFFTGLKPKDLRNLERIRKG